MPVHVFVDETRPRNQGAALTAFELGQHGVPHTLIADNAGGHLMQHGKVDMCIVGADRITARGDAANKIGTYLKALAAQANNVPFYVAAPYRTIDWTIEDGLTEIEIEERDGLRGHSCPGKVAQRRTRARGTRPAWRARRQPRFRRYARRTDRRLPDRSWALRGEQAGARGNVREIAADGAWDRLRIKGVTRGMTEFPRPAWPRQFAPRLGRGSPSKGARRPLFERGRRWPTSQI